MRILNQTKATVIADNARIADTFLSRSVGLLSRDFLPKTEALVLTRCQSIHMFFMRFCIDAIFVDKRGYVVGVIENLQPFQLSPVFWRASYCVELAQGVILESKTSIGDEIILSGKGE